MYGGRAGDLMKRQEASYTVELALLMPILVFVLFEPVYLGYELYECARQASVSGWEEGFDADGRVRVLKFTERVIEK